MCMRVKQVVLVLLRNRNFSPTVFQYGLRFEFFFISILFSLLTHLSSSVMYCRILHYSVGEEVGVFVHIRCESIGCKMLHRKDVCEGIQNSFAQHELIFSGSIQNLDKMHKRRWLSAGSGVGLKCSIYRPLQKGQAVELRTRIEGIKSRKQKTLRTQCTTEILRQTKLYKFQMHL